jgi:hypothetical protein
MTSIDPHRRTVTGGRLRKKIEDTRNYLKLLHFLVVSISIDTTLNPEHWWKEFTDKFDCCQIDLNHRGYWYTRMFPLPFTEVVICYFPAGSYTDIHDHDECLNLNLVITGGVTDRAYRSRNNKFKLMKEKILKPKAFSVVMPHQPHEMICNDSGGAITFNFHFPNRGAELT